MESVWSINKNMFALIACLVVLIYPYAVKNNASRNIPKGLMIIGILLSINFVLIDNLLFSMGSIPLLWLGIVLFSYKDSYREKLLQDFTKWFAVLTGFSLVCFLLRNYVPFPMINSFNLEGYPETFYNYGIFLGSSLSEFIPRFSGPFIEPGHLGIACVFFMYANHLRFGKNYYMWTLLAVCIATFSLAAYVLLGMAFILQMKIKLYKIILYSSLLLGSYYYITQVWDGGNNPMNALIVSRLSYDEDKGIAGNNRFNHDTDSKYEEWMKSGDLITGKGLKFYTEQKKNGVLGGAGYKIYIIQYGIIGTALIALLYFMMAQYSNDKRFAYVFFILVVLCFLQRTYPLWLSWMIPYSCSMVRLKKSNSAVEKLRNDKENRIQLIQ